MAFDYGRFERSVALSNLSRRRCSREILTQGACRYAVASIQPGERRAALRRAGVTVKQLKAQVAAAHALAGFLRRLQASVSLTIANDPPATPIPVWCRDLENISDWIYSLAPFRPDAKDAALALALHVEGQTGGRHLHELCKLLNAALDAAGLPNSLTAKTLQKQIVRANRQCAEEMLRFWESLAPAKKPQN